MKLKTVMHGEATSTIIELDAAGGTVGSGPDNTLVLPAEPARIAALQARLDWRGDGWYLRNMGIRFVVVNGRWLESGADKLLGEGDLLEFDSYGIRVLDCAAPAGAVVAPAASDSPAHAPLNPLLVDSGKQRDHAADPLRDVQATEDVSEWLGTAVDPLALFAGEDAGASGAVDLFSDDEAVLAPRSRDGLAGAPTPDSAAAVKDNLAEISGHLRLSALANVAAPPRSEAAAGVAASESTAQSPPAPVQHGSPPPSAAAAGAAASDMPATSTPAPPAEGASVPSAEVSGLHPLRGTDRAGDDPLRHAQAALGAAFLQGAGVTEAPLEYSVEFMRRLGALVHALRVDLRF